MNPQRWGLIVVVVGLVLIVAGLGRALRSPEVLSAFRVRQYEALATDRPVRGEEIDRYRREIRRLTGGAAVAAVGMGLMMGGLVLARYAQRSRTPIAEPRPLPSQRELSAEHPGADSPGAEPPKPRILSPRDLRR